MLQITNEALFDSIIRLTKAGYTLESSCEKLNVSRGYAYLKLSKEQLKQIKLSKVKKPKKRYRYTFTTTNEFNGFY